MVESHQCLQFVAIDLAVMCLLAEGGLGNVGCMLFVWLYVAAFLASVSAISLGGNSAWPGIQ